MHGMACFIRITTELNYTAFYYYEDVGTFRKETT